MSEKSTYDIPPELEEALRRVMLEETLDYAALLDKYKKFKNSENSLRAAQILAQKEINYAANKGEDEELESLDLDKLEKLKIKERQELCQYHKAFVKHISLADSLQNAVFNTQIQNCFYDTLKKEDNDQETNNKLSSILTNYNDNLNTSSEAVEIIENCENIDKDILELRLKYRETLKSIEKKWKVLQAEEPPSEQFKINPDVKALIEKLYRRESRLDLLIGLIQGLISGSGEIWGANPRLLQIMLLCDDARCHPENGALVRSNINELREIRSSKDKEGKVKKMTDFVTSTPH